MPEQTNQILVIDDDPVIRRLIVTVAREAGYPTSEVSDGAEALEMIEAGDFKLLILDLMLPGLSGYDVLDRLEPGFGCSVIIVTAGDDHDLDEIDSRLVCDNVRKPVDIHDLREAITRALDAKPASQTNQQRPLLKVKSKGSKGAVSTPAKVSRTDDDSERERSSPTELQPNDDLIPE
ncbi:MAG: response regulator [Acidobacteria bacterium]|nr:response regulator [Acidobacteriota bacterium]